MTQQEEQLLNGLIERVNNTQLQFKDTDAERLLQIRFSQNPDALYILCQTVLVQQFAMEKSQTDLQATRAELEQLKHSNSGEKHGSFLGNLLGLNKQEEPEPQPPAPLPAQYNNPTGTSAGSASYSPVNNAPPAYTQPTGYYPPQPYNPQQGYPAPQGYPNYPPPGYQPQYPPQGGYYSGAPMGGGLFGGGGGFLQGAMQTAAGVVAGEMAFRALEDVFSSGHERGFTGGETINNYYDDSGSRDSGGFGDRLAQADGYNTGDISSDIEDRRGDSHGFFDGGGDNNNSDTFADDNSSYDDSSNFDDGGGNDDNY